MPKSSQFEQGADPQAQWEWDRQQNIIDEIDNMGLPTPTDGTDPPLTAEQATALKRKNEARAVQNYLEKTFFASDEVNAAVDQADAEWVAANPPPPKEEKPDEE